MQVGVPWVSSQKRRAPQLAIEEQVWTQVLSDGRNTQPATHASQFVPVRFVGQAQRAVPVVSEQLCPMGQTVLAQVALHTPSWLLSWYPAAQVSHRSPVYSGRHRQTPWVG